MLKPTLALLLCVPFAATAVEPSLSLKDTFDSYARLITQGDEAAKAALRASFLTVDPDQYPHLADSVKGLDVISDMAASLQAPAGAALRDRQQRIACETDGIKEVAAEDKAIIEYTCTLPDLAEAFQAYRQSRARATDAATGQAEMKVFLQRYADVLRSAPDAPHSLSAEFFRAGENGPWVSVGMAYNATELVTRLLPLQEWEERIEAESITHPSGSAAPDVPPERTGQSAVE